MMVLLVLKERLRSIYGRFAVPLHALFKFCLSMAAMLLLNHHLGFMTRLKNPLAVAGIALACSCLPYGAISFILAAVMLLHIYVVSLEIALLTLIFLILVALLYYGLQPRDSYWLILTPLAFLFKVPYVIPLLAGLSGSLSSIVPVSCGISVFYILDYVKQNAGVLTNDASIDITQKYVQLIKAMLSNQMMVVFLIVCAVGILVVYLLRMLSVDYAWILSIVIGMITMLVAVYVGTILFGVTISIQELLVGILVSMVIAGIYHFFVFAVDYSRTEYVQFEDDDYVYYVKAVPKIVVSAPDVRVQRINNPKRTKRGANSKT